MPPSSLGGLGPRVAGVVMRSTGLTRLPVAENPHHTLTRLYERTLRALKDMPENALYRQSAEKVVKERLQIVSTTRDFVQLEQKLNAGMLEEVIVQAEYELVLARNMAVWKPWEELCATPPPNQWQWPMRSLGGGMSS